MAICPQCQGEYKNVGAHSRFCTGGNVAVAERPKFEGPRSQRGKRLYERQILAPIDQIRMQPAGVTGAWAYYLRPDGATIREALILYPNGGQPSAIDDPKGKFGTNASIYRERQRAKGFEYLGQRLDSAGMRKLVETLVRNRPDYILFLEDMIAESEQVLVNTDDPQKRDQARKRRGAFQSLLDEANAPFDAEKLLEELDAIAQAQRMANVDPAVLQVMREMIGEANNKTMELVQRFNKGRVSDPDGAPTGVRTTSARGMASRDAESMGGGMSFDADE
jgi:hypothetical protein